MLLRDVFEKGLKIIGMGYVIFTINERNKGTYPDSDSLRKYYFIVS
jgi:hypothetical protein